MSENAGLAGPIALLARNWKEILRFGIVGGGSSLIYMVVVYVCFQIFGIAEVVASAIGYLAAIPFNFLAQKFYTFRSTNKIHVEILPYAVVHGLNIGLSSFILKNVNAMSGNIWIASACVAIVIPFTSYILFKLVVFRPRQGQ